MRDSGDGNDPSTQAFIQVDKEPSDRGNSLMREIHVHININRAREINTAHPYDHPVRAKQQGESVVLMLIALGNG